MIKESKIGSLGGSLTATIPAGIKDLFEVDKGDKAVWIADTDGDGKILTVRFEKVKKENPK